MSKNALERALLNRFVTGSLGKNQRATWKEISRWNPIERAHAAANSAANISSTLLQAERHQYHDLIAENLLLLREGGWDGKTIEDYHKDVQALQEHLKPTLSPGDWKEYFEKKK